MLGFLRSGLTFTEFVSTTDFCPREPDPRHRYSVYDCRHGRVLLQFMDDGKEFLTVWNPMTGSQRVLRVPKYSGMTHWYASVLRSANGCNHSDCHLGPFLVVFVSLHEQEGVAKASVYSSETSNWSSPASLDVFFEDEINIIEMPSVLAEDALYFLISSGMPIILEYDLGKSRLSEIHLVSGSEIICPISPILMVAQDGQLGLTDLYNFNLDVWWREVGPDEVAVWSKSRVIDLKALLTIGDPEVATDLVGSVEGTGIIFAIIDLVIYMIDLKALTSKELSTELYQDGLLWPLFPYFSFYSPQGKLHCICSLIVVIWE
jgi:(2Fe-2S) ferredoxin